jgi:uncharacterized short protein YbdD (DUF466 family)
MAQTRRKVLSKIKRWKLENPDKVLQQRARWRARYPNYLKNWRRKNPDKVKRYRRAER